MSELLKLYVKIGIGTAAAAGWIVPTFFMKTLTPSQEVFTLWCMAIVSGLVGHFTGLSLPSGPQKGETPNAQS